MQYPPLNHRPPGLVPGSKDVVVPDAVSTGIDLLKDNLCPGQGFVPQFQRPRADFDLLVVRESHRGDASGEARVPVPQSVVVGRILGQLCPGVPLFKRYVGSAVRVFFSAGR